MPRANPVSKIETYARRAAVCLGLIAGTAILLASVERHYPIRHWLFWRYATYWVAAGVWSIGCAATGRTLLRLLLRRPLPFLEELATGFAVGVFAFQLAMFGLGLLGLYHPITFVALPLVFVLLGGTSFWRALERAVVHFRAPRRSRRWSAVTWLAIAFGFVSLIALYMPVMSPANSSFDARWRHLYIAEQYVLHGGIRRFDEGWTLGASPHFTSLLYTWGFMLPRGLLFDRIELAAHLEYVIFLWTSLVGVSALVRRLIPNANPAAAWAARFLFPGTMLYDSNLSVGADHIGAVFAPPLLLCALRMWSAPTVRNGVLLGSLIAAAVCAKETTALLLAPFPIALVALRFAIDLARGVRDRKSLPRLYGSAVAGVATVLLTAPHWLKNLIWYGDPLYPNLHKHFSVRPWSANSEYAFEYGFKTMLWAPTHDLNGLRQAFESMFTFSFRPFAWWSMHRDVPVFGSLFTLLLIVLPFIRGTKRIWYVVFAVHFSVFVWFWVHHEERHLQALVPAMAACVAAVATLIWRAGPVIVRACLALLIGAQAVWGADTYFIPTHNMILGAALKAPTELLGQGFLLNFERRFDIQLEPVVIGSYLPKGAVMLLHESRDHLGYGRKLIADHTGDQYGIDYLGLGTRDRIHHKLRSLGVTHLVWRDGEASGIAPLGSDIAFFDFAFRATTGKTRVASSNVAALADKPPGPADERLVGVLGCPGVDYPSGIYKLSDLATPRFGPMKDTYRPPVAPIEDEKSWSARVFAIALDNFCIQPNVPPTIDSTFERVARRSERWGRGHDLWLRRP